MASTYLTKTFSGAGNRKTWTMSAWIKRTALAPSSDIRVFGWKGNGGNYGFQFDSDQFRFYLCSGGSGAEFLTNRHFRDTNAWYHIVAQCDTTQSTASDRFKIYVNGVQETSFSTATYPNQNEDTAVNQAEICRLGCSTVAVNSHFDGLMSHVHFTDGYAYGASAFGSTDSTTGEWKINTDPSVTYGTNGFFLLKDDNAVTDRSGQGNNFALGAGTLSKTQDNPSNIFNTWNENVQSNFKPGFTYSNGNTTLAFATPASDSWGFSNIGDFAGKYYAEFKMAAFSNNTHYIGVKFIPSAQDSSNFTNAILLRFAKSSNAVAIYSGFTSGFLQENMTSLSAGDIIGIAVDIDNGTVQFYKNGSAFGNQVTGQTSNFSDKQMQFICFGEGHGSQSGRTFTINANFGNGYFGTTAVATNSGNGYQDADGNGIFNYTVPTNFRALCTKGLNQ